MGRTPSPLADARAAGRHLFWVALVFSVFVNLLLLTGPVFMLQVYDRVLTSRSEETLLALLLLVTGLFALLGLLDWSRARIVARMGGRLQERLDGPVFLAALRRQARGGQGGDYLASLRDVEAIAGFTASPVYLALMDLPWSPIFFLLIFAFDPWLGWLAVAGATVIVALSLLNRALTARGAAAARREGADADHTAARAETHAEVIRGLGMEGAIADRWRQRRRAALSLGLRASDWTGLFTSSARAFRLFLQSAMLAAGAYLVLAGRITPGAMIAASIILGRALAPLEQCVAGWQTAERARTGWKSLADLFATAPAEGARTRLPRPDARLAVESVTLVSPSGRGRTLDAISLEIRPGRALGVIGKSGSGKSTLARVVTGLVAPTAGRVSLGGATLDQYDPSDLADHIGYLPQEIALFDGTIAENIARMSADPDPDAVIRAARRAAVHDVIVALDAGYDTDLGGGARLSGGERQRIALARALYGNPVLLVLDEPNSALDHDGSAALNRVVREFKSTGRAVIIMTHRPAALSECDDLAVIDHGRLSAYGPRDSVLKAALRNGGEVSRAFKVAARE